MNKKFLLDVMDSKISRDSVLLSNVAEILQNQFGFDDLDTAYICYSVPNIFSVNNKEFEQNLNNMSGFLNLKAYELRFLILKNPQLLLLKSEIIEHKLKLLSVTFGMSIQNILRLLYHMPALFEIDKQQVKNQIMLIGDIFNKGEFGIRALLRREPRLLFLDKDTYDTFYGYVSKSLGFSKKEINYVINQCPEVMFNPNYDLCSILNLTKRDIKKLILDCPNCLAANKKLYEEQIKDFEKNFYVDKKEAVYVLQAVPSILFDDLNEKGKFFRNMKISKDYVINFPKIFKSLEYGLTLKYVLARTLGLDGHFDKILNFDAALLLSRLSFMQYYKFFRHSDILLDEDEFEKQYKINSSTLMQSFSPSVEIVSRLVKFYADNKNQNIPLPELNRFEDFLGSIKDFALVSPLSGPSRLFPLRQIFYCLGFAEQETENIIRRNFSLSLLPYEELTKVAKILDKYLNDKEKILNMIYTNPAILSYSSGDINFMIEQGLNESLTMTQVIKEII